MGDIFLPAPPLSFRMGMRIVAALTILLFHMGLSLPSSEKSLYLQQEELFSESLLEEEVEPVPEIDASTSAIEKQDGVPPSTLEDANNYEDESEEEHTEDVSLYDVPTVGVLQKKKEKTVVERLGGRYRWRCTAEATAGDGDAMATVIGTTLPDTAAFTGMKKLASCRASRDKMVLYQVWRSSDDRASYMAWRGATGMFSLLKAKQWKFSCKAVLSFPTNAQLVKNMCVIVKPKKGFKQPKASASGAGASGGANATASGGGSTKLAAPTAKMKCTFTATQGGSAGMKATVGALLPETAAFRGNKALYSCASAPKSLAVYEEWTTRASYMSYMKWRGFTGVLVVAAHAGWKLHCVDIKTWPSAAKLKSKKCVKVVPQPGFVQPTGITSSNTSSSTNSTSNNTSSAGAKQSSPSE